MSLLALDGKLFSGHPSHVISDTGSYSGHMIILTATITKYNDRGHKMTQILI